MEGLAKESRRLSVAPGGKLLLINDHEANIGFWRILRVVAAHVQQNPCSTAATVERIVHG